MAYKLPPKYSKAYKLSPKYSKIKKRNTVMSLVLLAVIVIAYFAVSNDVDFVKDIFNNKPPVIDTDFAVHFIDVGQGDSTLIKIHDKAILIDGGDYHKSDTVNDYLKQQEVEKLDLVVVSHFHTDHYGGLVDVIKTVPVDEVLLPDVKTENLPTNNTFRELMQTITDKKQGNEKLEVTTAKKDMTYDFDGGQLIVINQFPEFSNDDMNNTSIIVKFVYKEVSVLIAGDLEVKGENRLLDENADISSVIFKMNHHGSKTSNTLDFLRKVNADVYVITCGENNKYGHPHAKTYETLNELGAGNVYRTDKNGNIIFYSNANSGDELEVANFK